MLRGFSGWPVDWPIGVAIHAKSHLDSPPTSRTWRFMRLSENTRLIIFGQKTQTFVKYRKKISWRNGTCRSRLAAYLCTNWMSPTVILFWPMRCGSAHPSSALRFPVYAAYTSENNIACTMQLKLLLGVRPVKPVGKPSNFQHRNDVIVLLSAK